MTAPARDALLPLGHSVQLEALDRDPYPIYAQLLEHEPVSWIPALGMWYVTRRADVVAVLDDPAAYSVEAGDSLLQQTFATTTTAPASVAGVISTDGPEQARLRQPFYPPFLPAETRRAATSFVRRRLCT